MAGELGDELVLVGVVSLALDERQCSQTAAVLTRVTAFSAWMAEVARAE